MEMNMRKTYFVALLFSFLVTPLFSRAIISERLQQALAQATEEGAPVKALVMLADRVDIQALDQQLYEQGVSPEERAYIVISSLEQKAQDTQGQILAYLASLSSAEVREYRDFWVANMIAVEATPAVIMELSARAEVEFLDLDALLEWDQPVRTVPAEMIPNGAEPGLKAINAHKMWQAGYTGAGTIVMNIDTGVDGNHPAINYKWRGTHVPASQAWFDPAGSTFPNDCDNHGTHTIGTMSGLQTATHDTIGVAFGAEWIAAKTICSSPHTSNSIAAFQWALNPDGNPATTSDMPVAIGNSWYDPNISSSTQCNPSLNPYINVISALEAAGVAVVFSAGNNGPSAQSITSPKNVNINQVSFWATGAVNGNVTGYPIASFSSRGPVVSACSTGVPSLDIKPEACAPGVSVRSSIRNGGYSYYDGTSMACPHVVGAIALLKQAHPTKTGHELKMALYNTASDLGVAGEDNTYGKGIINVWAAHNSLLAGPPDISVSPASFNFTVEINGSDSGVLTISNSAVAGSQSLSWSLVTETTVSLALPGGETLPATLREERDHSAAVDPLTAQPFSTGGEAICPWLSGAPTSGNLTPGSSANITVTVNAAGLSPGTYNCNLKITSNDPDENPLVVPVELSVSTGGSSVLGSVQAPAAAASGCPLTANIRVDMSSSLPPNHLLGSFTATLNWDPALLTYTGNSGILSGFTGFVNDLNAANGSIIFNGAKATGQGGLVEILQLNFDAAGSQGTTPVLDLEFSVMAAAMTFTNLMPYLTVDDATVSITEAGVLGDINEDGIANSTDALVLLSADAGFPIPPAYQARIDAGFGDVNDDGLTNSTDGLIILSFDAGIQVPYPVGQAMCP